MVSSALVSIALIVTVPLVVATHRVTMDTSLHPDDHFPTSPTLRSSIVDEFKGTYDHNNKICALQKPKLPNVFKTKISFTKID